MVQKGKQTSFQLTDKMDGYGRKKKRDPRLGSPSTVSRVIKPEEPMRSIPSEPAYIWKRLEKEKWGCFEVDPENRIKGRSPGGGRVMIEEKDV